MAKLAEIAAFFSLLCGPVIAVLKTFDNVLTNGSIHAEFISTNTSSLDGPKLGYPGPANNTSYDWWYFDAVSDSTNASVVVVFYNSGPDGFINTYYGGPLSVSITGTFANGTAFGSSIPASSLEVEYGPDEGISLNYTDSGFSFTGSNVKSRNVEYVLNIDSPAIGIKGLIRMHSRAPGHYPCGPNTPGSNLQLLPHIGWSNAMPDAHTVVSLLFTTDNNNKNNQTTTLAFHDGVGYHDKNWGDRPFLASTAQWYWGHARLGPYSLVWADAFDVSGTEYASCYAAVANNGPLLLEEEASCAGRLACVARPWGVNGTFPPSPTTGPPQGLEVAFDLGGGEDVLRVNVTTGTVMIGGPAGYSRMLGTVRGGVDGGEVFEGRALFEQFNLIGMSTNETM